MEVRHLGFDDDLGERRIADDEVVGDRVVRPGHDPEPGGGVRLGIQIEDEHPRPDRRQRRAEIDRRGGFADAAFLIGDREDSRRPVRTAAEPAPGFLNFRSIFRCGVRF